MEITLNALQCLKLGNLLLKCPSVRVAGGRETLVQLWEKQMGKTCNARRDSSALADVVNLVEVFTVYESGLEIFIELVGEFDNGSIPYQKVLAYLEELKQEATLLGEGSKDDGLRLRAPGLGGESANKAAYGKEVVRPRWEGSPFPGLRSFTRKDEPIFFGREAEAEALTRKVEESRFVGVVGASGSGKSSLVAAGLLPRLEGKARSGPATEGKNWYLVQFKPGEEEQAFGALFEAMVETFEVLRPKPFERRQVKKTFIENMMNDPATVCETLEEALNMIKAPDEAEVLLFIDQFEELFTLAKVETREPFAKMLGLVVGHPRLRVVVTIRHDFVHRAIEISELAELLQQGFFSLAAPTIGALAQMVKRPAEVAGLEFEAGLPEEILLEAGSGTGSLALMAYTLDELYKVAARRGDKRLLREDYEQLGGVKGAIGKRAEESFERLSGTEEEKTRLLGWVFRELVEVDERGTATRKRALHARFGGVELELVEAFTKARLLVKEAEYVEVAHEALFGSWERLRRWIGEAQEDFILERQVRNGAAEWERKGRAEYLRWPQERLALVYAMLERHRPDLSEVERSFIEPEQARLQRELEKLSTTHQRRREIGDRLDLIGDTRRGIGVDRNGVPEIEWLAVAPGGKIKIEEESYTVQPFYIAKYAITYAQYEVFVRAKDGFENPEWRQEMPEKYQKQRLNNQRTKSWNNPRDSVSWYQAVAFTRWLDRRLRGLKLAEPGNPAGRFLIVGENGQVRLPTEWEWQWAAQGGNVKREYPWGEWREDYANTYEAGLSRAIAVGIYPQGAALCGALDMGGNIWEWCQNKYSKDEERRVVRGGSFGNVSYFAACASRNSFHPGDDSNRYGFRVVLGEVSPASEFAG